MGGADIQTGAKEATMTENWHRLIAESDFPEEGKLASRLSSWHILVAKVDGVFVAVNDRCTHQAAQLSGGKIRRGTVMCPLHGARFDMATGRCIGGPYRELRTFACRVSDGIIEVAIPDGSPGLDEIPIGA